MTRTARSEYALLALVHLGRQKLGEWVSAETIAKAQDIPMKFLEQIVLTLERARYLRSMKGQRGGYEIAKSVDSLTLAEGIRLLEGAPWCPLVPTDSTSRFDQPILA